MNTDHYLKNLDESAQNALKTYKNELLEWNEKVNLTGITDPAEVDIKHFEDSLSILQAIPSAPENQAKITLIDVGSGAGFPGLPIAIVRPDIRVTLMESIGKKVHFLEHIRETLGLKNVDIEQVRAEEAGQHPDYREHYDIGVARAVARLPILCEYILPFVKVGGLMIAQKIVNDEEIESAQNAIRLFGGELEKIIPVTLTDGSLRHLVIIKKVAPTPIDFPRKAGVPAQDPIL